MAIAAFTGTGFASTKLICISGRIRSWTLRAVQSRRARRFDHLHHVGRDLVRRNRDDAAPANRHQRQRNRVVSGQDDEVRRHAGADLAHLCDVARRLLHADDVRESAIRASVAGSTFTPVRPGTL